MSWYWWVLVGILAINVAAIGLIALVMIADLMKKRKNARENRDQ